jgi:SAM-dependent methyltransferase
MIPPALSRELRRLVRRSPYLGKVVRERDAYQQERDGLLLEIRRLHDQLAASRAEQDRLGAELSDLRTKFQTGNLERYVASAPSPANAVGVFAGQWSSQLPDALGQLPAGNAVLFTDKRVPWALDKLRGAAGRRVLELGPLEGGHTYQLHEDGAADILAVEANSSAYLRCLVVKELLGLTRARFALGDFVEYLRGEPGRWDLVWASGVLYHLRDPAEVIRLISRVTDRLYIWTHYYDADLIAAMPNLPHRFTGRREAEHHGFRHTLYRQEYQEGFESFAFCGGGAAYSEWMSRADLLACLRHFGFDRVSVAHERHHHPSGPSFSVAAWRTAGVVP